MIIERKKKIIRWASFSILALILIGLVLYPFIFGMVSKNLIEKSLSDIKEKSKDQIQISWEIQRTYFSSQLNLEVIQLLKDATLAPKINLKMDLNHWKMVGIGEIVLGDDFLKNYLKNFAQVPTISFETKFSLFGSIKCLFHFGNSAFSFDAGEGETPYKIQLGESDILLALSGNSLNDLKFLISSVQLETKDSISYGKDVVLAWEKKEGLRTTDAHLTINFNELKNPEFAFTQGNIKLDFLNFDNKFLEKFSAILVNLKGIIVNQQSAPKVLMELASELPRLIERNPRIELNIVKIKTEEGDFSLESFLGLAGDGPVGLFNFLQSLESKVRLTSPEKNFEKILSSFIYWGLLQEESAKIANDKLPAMGPNDFSRIRTKANSLIREKMNDFFEKKYIIKKDSGLFSEFVLKKGEMTLNGSPFYLSLGGD